jgi:transcription initiation factor TFIID subunit 7
MLKLKPPAPPSSEPGPSQPQVQPQVQAQVQAQQTGAAIGTGKQEKPKRRRKPAEVSTKIKISGFGTKAKDAKKEKLDELIKAPEEQAVILRLPPSQMTKDFREAVKKRRIPPGFAINFSDPRTATVTLGMGPPVKYSAKLVDLPCIIESQKTIDNRQFYKIGDICQVFMNSWVYE